MEGRSGPPRGRPSAAVPTPSEFRFRKLDKPEEFRQAEELERTVLGSEGALALSAPVLRALQDHGGLVLGAFADIYLAGCSLSTIGWDGTKLYHYSHLTVVRPEYQNHHVGLRLKAFQREQVLALGLEEIRWVFDPLASRSAWLSVGRLAAVPERYLVHYFGALGDPSNPSEGGNETDRLGVRWVLSDPTVERRLGGSRPSPSEMQARWGSSSALIETAPGESGLRLPTAVSEPAGGPAHLEVPFDLASLRAHERSSLRTWRHAVRDAFRGAFDQGYRVDDFAVVSAEHERRSFYFLSPPAPGSPSARPPL